MTISIAGRQSGSDGVVRIAGAKNSVLPLALSSLLVHGTTTIENVPSTITDLSSVRILLELCGAGSDLVDRQMLITNVGPNEPALLEAAFRGTRYSALLLSILLRLFGRARVLFPGGCSLGCSRPLDIYLDGLSAFGIQVEVDQSSIKGVVRNERYGTFVLRYPSVVATEGLILFSVIGRGTRVLRNCAKEPEVQDLIGFLNASGAQVIGAGTDEVVVQGVDHLKGVRWKIIPDRIEAGTFAFLAVILRKDLTLEPVELEHIGALLEVMAQMGVPYEYCPAGRRLTIKGRDAHTKVGPVRISTAPFPGFPTDLQPLLTVLCLKAHGRSLIHESVFPGRFRHIAEIQKMGGRVAVVNDKDIVDESADILSGAQVYCHDIRSGAACVLAALLCSGISVIRNEDEVKRGYDHFFDKLRSLQIDIDQIL